MYLCIYKDSFGSKILTDDFALNVYWEIYEFEFDITDSSRVNKIGAFNDGPFKNIGVNREGHAHT